MKTHHCACGCGTLIPVNDKKGIERRYKKGHSSIGRKTSIETRIKLSAANIGRKHTIEEREKISAAQIGVAQTSHLTKKGPTNKQSRSGVLRDAMGRIWPFLNLKHFVRENTKLFNPEDVTWRIDRWRNEVCRASNGLGSLFRKKGRVLGSWKGWTVAFSIMERAEGGGDLMGRDCATVVELAK